MFSAARITTHFAFRIRIYQLATVVNHKRTRTQRALTIAQNCSTIWLKRAKTKRIGTITNRTFQVKRKAKYGKHLPWLNHLKRKKMNSWLQLNGTMSWPTRANQKSSSLPVSILSTLSTSSFSSSIVLQPSWVSLAWSIKFNTMQRWTRKVYRRFPLDGMVGSVDTPDHRCFRSLL